MNTQTGEMSYGFASNLSDALPNASFIGFTGTPIEKTDANTRAVFGEGIAGLFAALEQGLAGQPDARTQAISGTDIPPKTI